MTGTQPSTARGLSPVFATVLLVGITVVGAAVVGTLAFGQAAALDREPPRAAFSLAATGDRISLVHEQGDAVAVGPLRLTIAVDGEALAHQPPVPFFAARGFRGGPTGPFNPSESGRWTAGETASLRVAETNTPALEPGSKVTVGLFHQETRIASLTTQVQQKSRQNGARYSGTVATVTIARGLPGLACMMTCSNSVKPASTNIRSASSAS